MRRGKYETKKETNTTADHEINNQPLGFTKTVLLYLHDLVYLLGIILLLLLLLFRVVVVSGSSMNPTLIGGDYLLLISTPFYTSAEYGDIVVASKDSFENGEPIIKRVIATEGQTVDIDFDKGVVYVDGIALQEDYINNATTLDEGMQFPLVVEEGCVFVLGDNRGRSQDSRSPLIGLIDTREILGKAFFLFLPGMDADTKTRDFSRIGGLS
jgi:signal peptidase I